jgi:TRAP-type C4-dicarboxylate transport system permease small subunit
VTSGSPAPRSRIAQILTLLAAAALGVMMLWTIADVVLRATLRLPINGSVALVETTLVLVAILALADCLSRDEQIKVDIFDQMISPRKLFALKLLGDGAMLVFVSLLATTMIPPIRDAWRFRDMKPDIPVPIVALLGVIELALVVSVFVLAAKIVRAVRQGPGHPGPARGPSAGETP